MSAEHTTRAVRHDRWDREDLAAVRRDVSVFKRARKKLGEFVSTGTQALDDVFLLLYRADPHLVEASAMQSSYLVNHSVATEMMNTSALRRLREHTVNDATLSALGAAELELTLETVFDRLSFAQEIADRIAALRASLAELREAVRRAELDLDAATGDLDEAALQSARGEMDRLADAQDALAAALEAIAMHEGELTEALDAHAIEVTVLLEDSLNALRARTATTATTAAAWGFEPGDLQRLPSAERMRLARTLNTPRMREIADLFGRIRNLSFSAATEVEDRHEEVVDLELGSDLSRVVPAELLGLATPETEAVFLARWADRELMQYEVESTDEAGRGGIVMCIDGSFSMANEREHWAKAVMLVLLHQAKAQRRSMHVVHFGYHQTTVFHFEKPADFTAEKIIEASEAFWASGTDFTEPMTVAVGLLAAEFEATGRTQADVVFCTDDECHVPEVFMAEYLAEMHRMGARTWGVSVVDSVDPNGPLTQMSEGRVMTIKDLRSGRDLRPMLLGTR